MGVPVASGRSDTRPALAAAVAGLAADLVPAVGEQARGVRCTLPLAV